MALWRVILLGICCLVGSAGVAAQPIASKKNIQLHFDNIPLHQVLQQLRQRYQVKFSYSNDHLPLQQEITYHSNSPSINKAIRQLFKENDIICAYIGKQYVLKPNIVRQRKRKERRARKKKRIVRSQQTLNRESLFEKDFRTKILGTPKEVAPKKKLSTTEIEPLLAKRIGTTQLQFDSTNLLPDAHFKAEIHPRVLQVSLFPTVSTNGRHHDKVTNIASWNILLGLGGGLQGVEIGGIGNQLRREAQGLQLAGFFNQVGGGVQGAQLSGIANMTMGKVIGLQGSSFVNLAGNMYGMQGSLLCNLSSDLYGLQLSGISNIASDVYGFQAGGLFNFANGKLYGSQFAGLGNMAWGGKSAVQLAGLFNYSAAAQLQLSGFLNMAQYIDGAQISLFNSVNRALNGCQIGVLNQTQTLNGAQIGLINSAKKAKGVMLGLVNVVDSIQGVPLGLINIIKRNGYNRIEISTGDILYFQLGAKFGAPRFYQIMQLGWQVDAQSAYVWSIGGGLGTVIPLNKYLQTNFELLASKVSEGVFWEEQLNLLHQLKINLDIRIQDRINIFIGPVLNVHIARSYNPETQQYGSNLAPYTFINSTNKQGTNFKLWIGISGGLRF